MTVSSETNRVSYAGAGTTGPFTVPFYFLNDADLKLVVKEIATGVETDLVITADYTLTGAGNPAGGAATLVAALATGYSLSIIRDPAATQETDYPPYDKFPAEDHERALDRLTMLVQRLRDIMDRAVRLSDGDTSGASLVVPEAAAGKALVWNVAGNALVNSEDTFEGVVADAQAAAAFERAQAEIAAANAATSAAVALGALAPVVSTSTTSLLIGTGSKSLVTQAGELWAAGHPIKIAHTTNPAVNYMTGVVTAYNTSTGDLTATISAIGGSGTIADWTLTLAGSGGGAVPWASVTGTPTDLAGYGITDAAPLASPTFTGAPAAPTASAGTASTQLATTAFVDALRDVAQNAQSAAYQLALTDRGGAVDISTGGVTVPANATVAFAIGSVITITNTGATAQTITQAAGVTLRMAGTTSTGNRTLAEYGQVTLRKTATNTWFIAGAGLS